MVKREGKIEKEILLLLGAGVTAYFVYGWYKKSQMQNFSNASGRPATPWRPNKIKPIEAVITSQAQLSRIISSAKSKGIQVPEQRLMQTFNTYKSALKSGTDIPPTIITAGKWKWKFGIWWRKPPGIKITINI
tara:strand:+ start:248 stop:646 length:399 start_codon:yes stop_codon:yes gene_type:complete